MPINPSRSWHIARRLFTVAVGLYLIVALAAAIFQRALIYHRARDRTLHTNLPSIAGATIHPVELTTEDNLRLRGWHVAAGDSASRAGRGSLRPSRRTVVLYFCGHSGTRRRRIPEFTFFAKLGVDVVCFDYRGYGDNEGCPSEGSFAADSRAIWMFLTGVSGFDPDQIIIFGESLGGGVGTRLAADVSAAGSPPAGLILRSTFNRLPAVAAQHYPWLPVEWLMIDRYPSAERISRVACPILIIHGRRDTVVPLRLARELFEAAPQRAPNGIPKRFVELSGGDHDNVLEVGGATAVGEFLERVFGNDVASPENGWRQPAFLR